MHHISVLYKCDLLQEFPKFHWCFRIRGPVGPPNWFEYGPDSPVLQQDLGDQVLQAGVEGLGEEVEDLLWSAQVVEDDVIGQDVERLDQLEDTRSPQIFFIFVNELLVFCVFILCVIVITVIFRAVDKLSMRVRATCAAWAAGMLREAAVVSASKRLGRL